MEKVAGRVICTFSGRKKNGSLGNSQIELGQLVDVREISVRQALNRVFSVCSF